MSVHRTFDKVTLLELQQGHRRIVWDDQGFIVAGQEVLEDIRHQPKNYSENVELVNAPSAFSERLRSSRVSSEHVAASGFASRIYEAISRDNPDGSTCHRSSPPPPRSVR